MIMMDWRVESSLSCEFYFTDSPSHSRVMLRWLQYFFGTTSGGLRMSVDAFSVSENGSVFGSLYFSFILSFQHISSWKCKQDAVRSCEMFYCRRESRKKRDDLQRLLS